MWKHDLSQQALKALKRAYFFDFILARTYNTVKYAGRKKGGSCAKIIQAAREKSKTPKNVKFGMNIYILHKNEQNTFTND